MKINNKKIIVSTLALAMGAALAGSVSGTVAWFQYSTRAQATFIGSSVHCSELLEVRANGGEFGTELSKVAPAANTGDKLEPISTGGMAKDGTLPSFYKNPIYQYNDSSKWGAADAHNYLQYTLDFHVLDVDGTANSYLTGHSLYLTDVEIVSLTNSSGASTDTTSDSKDLYKAVRVHVESGSYKALFAANGSTGDIVTTTHGALDLNGDGANDQTAGYDWSGARSEIDYGLVSGEGALNAQTAYNASDKTNFADDTTPIPLSNSIAAPGKIGTITNAQVGISVTVTIWIEGWTPLMNPAVLYTAEDPEVLAGTKEVGDVKVAAAESPIWDPATYIGKNFGVGLRFATEAHEQH